MSGPNPLLEAALGFAARGWPVFPCNPADKKPLLGKDRDAAGQAIRGTGGLTKATTDPATIRSWWQIKWPMGMVGLATGHHRLFVVDFDPRIDPETGEEWTLERLKAELEDQIGVALPSTLAVCTPSGGVHLYFLWPDDGGAPIRNRGNLPDHVDVRGLGGYVIAPPSFMQDGLRYRWLRGLGPDQVDIAEAPAELVAVLRAPKAARASPAVAPRPFAGGGTLPADLGEAERDAIRRYGLAGLDAELQAVRSAPSGRRNAQLNESALKIATLVAAGAVDSTLARYSLEAAARENPGRDDDGQLLATIESGWSAGLNNPRDLAEIAAAARGRASRPARRPGPSGRPAPRPDRAASPAPPPTPPPPASSDFSRQPFRNGRMEGNPPQSEGAGDAGDPMADVGESDRARLARIAQAWLGARLEHVGGIAKSLRAKPLTALAWGVGRRVSAGLLDEEAAKEKLWELQEVTPDVTLADVDRAMEDGFLRGFDPAPALRDLGCAQRPMTDFGLAERFLDRWGSEFRFTTAKGWLGWDGRRWKVLDQDKDTLPAPLIAAVFETIRDVQREARRIAETGVKWSLIKEGKEQRLDLDDEGNPHGLDRWVAKGRGYVLFSTMLAAWGRQSEQAGKPAAIANLVRGTPGLARERWLTVRIEDFDREPMAINVLNGTLRFTVEELPDGTKKAAVQLHRHRREDLLTRVAAVAFDADAASPLYDAMLAWAQPEPYMRRYLHQVGGYGGTGDTGEHKLWFHWGGGRNGKSTTIDSWCSALGDYSDTIAIESFLDQGIKKRGDQATPDLAKLGGIRLLRASEPGQDAKLNAALIKAVTGGEPMSVRALHRGFFNLQPAFKLNISGNSKPDIPETDDGIWSRMKLVPWLRNIEKPDKDPFKDDYPESHAAWPEKDTKLLDKIKATELAGVFRHLVGGLCDWLEHGFAEPDRVARATEAYRDQSDPLARFLRLCTVQEAEARVKSSELHDVFVAWCKAAGEREWKPRGFSDAMIDKGYEKTRSDGMRWIGLRLVKGVSDFVDHEGNVRLQMTDDERAADAAASGRGDWQPPRHAPGDEEGDLGLP